MTTPTSAVLEHGRQEPALLAAVAEQLTTVHPDRPMTGTARMTVAAGIASRHTGAGTRASVDATRQLLAVLPHTESGITRSRYARHLQTLAPCMDNCPQCHEAGESGSACGRCGSPIAHSDRYAHAVGGAR